MLKKYAVLISLSLTSCLGIPQGIKPVSNFHPERYLGTWYEIARLDHSFERNLSKVSATYSMRDDGGIDVINRGFNKETNEWKEARGKAYFVEGNNTGYLKVSFFGPFYASYIIFDLDEDYQWAFVTGSQKSYLWLLSRQKSGNKVLIEAFLKKAKNLGYDTEGLIFVKHD